MREPTFERPEPDEEGIVTGQTRLEEADFVRAHARIPALRNAMYFRLVLPALLLLVGAVLGIAEAATGASDAWPYAIVAALGAWLGWRGWRVPVREFRALQDWQRSVRFEVGPRGLRSSNEKTADELDWDVVTSWLECERAFYLDYLVVPKRAFASERDVALVRDLLEQKVRGRTAPDRSLPRAFLVLMFLVALGIALYARLTS